MRVTRMLGLIGLVLFVSAPSFAEPPLEDYIPLEARQVAEAEFKALVGAPTLPVFGLNDLSLVRAATLAMPFKYYWAGPSFAGFDAARPNELLSFLEGECICFPVVVGTRTLGTINVMKNKNGQYKPAGRSVGEGMYANVRKVREAVADELHPFVTPITIRFSGHYIVVGDGQLAYQIVATDDFAARVTATEVLQDDVVLHPISMIASPFSQAARRFRERSVGREVEIEETHDLDH